jgi:hypothetical protein
MSRVTQSAKSGRYVATAVAVVAAIAYATQGGPNASHEPSIVPKPVLVAAEPSEPMQASPPIGQSLTASSRQPSLSPIPDLAAPTNSADAPVVAKLDAAPARADIRIVPRIAAPSPPAPQHSLSAPVAPLRNETPAVQEPLEAAQAADPAPIAAQRPTAKRDQPRRKPARAIVTDTGCVPFVWPGDHGHPDRWKTVCGSRSKPSRKS